MKIMVTGSDGQLGRDVCAALGSNAIGVTRKDFDLTDEIAVNKYIINLKPEAIIHCAAYTAVDKAESESEICHAVNVLGTRYVAEAAAEVGTKLVYISTDYVFDGALSRPYEIHDATNPLSVYGRSKLEGENAVKSLVEKHFIVRVSWLYGTGGGNFVKTMLRLGRESGKVKVVDDQFGSPTYTPNLAKLLAEMVFTDKYGVYHATNEGFCSWYEFAYEIFKLSGMDVDVTPVSTEGYITAAKRPRDSRLSKQSLTEAGFGILPDWREALGRFLAQCERRI